MIPRDLSRAFFGVLVAPTRAGDSSIVDDEPGKQMRIRLSITPRLAALLMVLSGPISAQNSSNPMPRDDSWANLKHITHRRSYLVVDRELNCAYGTITGVTSGSLTLKTDSTSTRITIERPKILRIMEGPTGEATVYSGKSSWSEIKTLSPQVQVQIVTKQGDQRTGKLFTANDMGMSILLSGKQVEFVKGELARVYVVRNKPLSDGAEFASRELFDGFVFPELWPYILKLPPKISVLIYDSSLPEDNGSTRCKNDPLR